MESNERKKKVDSLTPKSPPTFEESTSESTFFANQLILLPKADDSDCFPELWGGNQNAERWESNEKQKKVDSEVDSSMVDLDFGVKESIFFASHLIPNLVCSGLQMLN